MLVVRVVSVGTSALELGLGVVAGAVAAAAAAAAVVAAALVAAAAALVVVAAAAAVAAMEQDQEQEQEEDKATEAFTSKVVFGNGEVDERSTWRSTSGSTATVWSSAAQKCKLCCGSV